MQFHVISFEGPDPYARAGGLATRVDGLSRALARLGYETHLWFIGDPDAPGEESCCGVQLHRWCQWISQHHRAGVYAGEEGKREDLTRSLPPFLVERFLKGNERAAVLAEEWHTAAAVIELDRRLRDAGARDRVSLLWNANNLFGFDRIDWGALTRSAVVTTVSRFMRLRMEAVGVRPLVLPNGLPPEAFEPPDRKAVNGLRARLSQRTVLAKVARWDPEKSWLYSIEAVCRLREAGLRPLLIARGGAEAHESDVREAARRSELRWLDHAWKAGGVAGLLDPLPQLDATDVVCVRSPIDPPTLRVLFRAADAVLANSRFEPFGLVALEAMAAGGVACTGLTGEDYAILGRNALVLQTEDPAELVAVLRRLREHPEEERALRSMARRTAREFAWENIVTRVLLPRLELLQPGPIALPRA